MKRALRAAYRRFDAIPDRTLFLVASALALIYAGIALAAHVGRAMGVPL